MRISQKTNYALLTMLDLARHQQEEAVSASDIARRQGIPQKFLEQILVLLKTAGLVASRRGQKGGYHLVARPQDITLNAVIQLTEGNFQTVSAAGSKPSPFDEVWAEIDNAIAERLNTLTIQDMCTRAEELEQQGALQYVI